MLHSSSFDSQVFSFEEAHTKVAQFIDRVSGKVLVASHSITPANSYTLGEKGEKIQQYYVSLIVITE